MLNMEVRPLFVGFGGMEMVFLLTIPSMLATVSQMMETTLEPKIYEDIDGISTEALTSNFSNKNPKIILLVFEILGLATSVYLAVFEMVTNYSPQNAVLRWVDVIIWVCSQRPREDELTLLRFYFYFKLSQSS